MKNVEQNKRLFQGYQWAEPLGKGEDLTLERRDNELHITGILPRYGTEHHPADLVSQYELAAKYSPHGRPRTTEQSPEYRFANAIADDDLIAFVRRFGPVIASCAYTNFERPEKGVLEPSWPPRLYAVQDLQELRNEQLIYRSALALVDLLKGPKDLTKRRVLKKSKGLKKPHFNYFLARDLIGEIATKVTAWPAQRRRERSQSKTEPLWNLRAKSLKRIKSLRLAHREGLLPPELDARIVICELLNSFPGIVFPNPLEMHSTIKFGIRPLLYSLLRRQFVSPRDFSLCANTQCRNFFNIERTGQRFCGTGCSTHQRQRTYWAIQGRKIREKRLRERKKAKKKH